MKSQLFKKYPSIENSYSNKHVNRWLEYHPELMDEEYVLQEKLHGANIQFIFTPQEQMKVASRNRVLADKEDFYNVFDVIEAYEVFTKYIQHLVDTLNYNVNVYGEIFGGNVQKGVDYGPNKRILFFDMRLNDKWYTQKEFYSFMKERGFGHLVVPMFDLAPDLNYALVYPVDKDSMLLEKEDNTCEGAVIKPWNKVYESPDGELFYLKKKNDKFLEKNKGPKTPREHVPDHPLKAEFLLYLTENRLEGIFSKYGRIEKPQQIGEYIRYMLEDAKTDFLKENEVDGLSKETIKEIFSVGHNIMTLLKKHL